MVSSLGWWISELFCEVTATFDHHMLISSSSSARCNECLPFQWGHSAALDPIFTHNKHLAYIHVQCLWSRCKNSGPVTQWAKTRPKHVLSLQETCNICSLQCLQPWHASWRDHIKLHHTLLGMWLTGLRARDKTLKGQTFWGSSLKGTRRRNVLKTPLFYQRWRHGFLHGVELGPMRWALACWRDLMKKKKELIKHITCPSFKRVIWGLMHAF